jgi:cytochrome b
MHSDNAGKVLIWDLPLRVFHWLLAISILGSWLTHRAGPDGFLWHTYFGYTALVLVTFRLLWGFVGPRHARFGSFLRGPRTAWTYVRSLRNPSAQHYPGHNPLGGWMTLFFLLLILTQGICGLFANDEIASTGPLYGYVSDERSDWFTGWHHWLANVLWVAIGLHVLVVVSHLLFMRDNLIGPMFTGRKSGAFIPPQEAIPGSRIVLAIILAAACAGLLTWVVRSAPEASMVGFF